MTLHFFFLVCTVGSAEHPVHGHVGADRPAAHGGVLVENYYYHLPMFAQKPLENPHTYQGVWKVLYKDGRLNITSSTLLKFSQESAKAEFKKYPFGVFTVDPKPFVLAQLGMSVAEVGAKLFAGHFEVPGGHREITNELATTQFVLEADGPPLRLHRLDPTKLARPKSLTYFAFGGKYLAKWLTVGPDSDHIVEVEGAGAPAKLKDGAQVVFKALPNSSSNFLKVGQQETGEMVVPSLELGQPVEVETVRLRVVSEVFRNDVLESNH
jgi:hypothetical protein